MGLSTLLENLGEPVILAIGGLIIGLIFGAAAQQSNFCLRAATVEFWRGKPSGKTGIWLIVFSVALLASQWLMFSERLDVDSVRQLSTPGTMAGAVVGGLMFGVGMVLARGCASRLLVLSGTGNLRALLTGLVLTIVAQASLTGVLSPLRIEISRMWMVAPETRNLNLLTSWSSILLAGLAMLALAVLLSRRSGVTPYQAIMAALVGLMVAMGWGFTQSVATESFEIVSVESISFTGPSTNTLMTLINEPTVMLEFGTGLVPGVFLGSFMAAWITGQFRLQVFNAESGLVRYLGGASLMGFGAMLAGGCAVGAGVTGGAVLSLTAWVALFCMWVGAGLADLVLRKSEQRTDTTKPAQTAASVGT